MSETSNGSNARGRARRMTMESSLRTEVGDEVDVSKGDSPRSSGSQHVPEA